jgi:putative tricarboxylic transport membrane protein
MPTDSLTRRAEVAYIVLILAVAGVVWWQASALPPAPYDPLGPKSFPMGVSAVLAALGLTMLVRLLLGGSLGERAHAMLIGVEAGGQHTQRPWVAAATLLLAMGYAAALSFRTIGFLPATAVYLFASGAVLGPFAWKRMLGILAFAVGAAIALDLLFRVLFQLDLT